MPAPDATLASSSRTRTSWPHLLLSLIGGAISIYAFIVHQRIKAGGESGCGFTETLNCDTVLSSNYAQFLGIPLGLWGLAYFVIALLFATWKETPARTQHEEQQARLLQLGVATCGFAVSVALTYISHTYLHALCPICLATHAVTTALLIVSLWQWYRLCARSQRTTTEN